MYIGIFKHGYCMTITKINIQTYRPISSVVRAPPFRTAIKILFSTLSNFVEVVGSNPTWAKTTFLYFTYFFHISKMFNYQLFTYFLPKISFPNSKIKLSNKSSENLLEEYVLNLLKADLSQ